MATKVCSKCKESKELVEFNNSQTAKDKKQSRCRECERQYQQLRSVKYAAEIQEYSLSYIKRKRTDHDWRIKQLIQQAKRRASKKNLPFDLTLENVKKKFPAGNRCPVFGFELTWGNSGFRETSPSIDRIDSSKGYTCDNIQVISWKANRLKSNFTLADIEALALFMRSHNELH